MLQASILSWNCTAQNFVFYFTNTCSIVKTERGAGMAYPPGKVPKPRS